MALVDVVQAFLFQHAQAFLEREGNRDGRREGRHSLVRPGLRLLPVEVEARRPRLRLLAPRALADADQGQTRGRHPALLRTADRDVDAPRVGFDVDRADRADAVDDDDPLGVAARPRELPQRVGQTRRRLVVGEQEHPRLGVPLQDHGEVVGLDRLPPFELEAHHVGAVGRGESRKPFAEVSTQRDDDLVAGRDEVGHRRLQASGARAGQQQEVVLGPEYSLRPGRDLGQDRRELGPAVIDHRPVHAPDHPLRKGCRSRDSKLC